MKKTTLKLLSFIALSAIASQAKAQGGWSPTSTQTVTSSGITKVGIGTSSPTEALTVNGNIELTPSTNPSDYRAVLGNSDVSGLYISGSNDGASIMLNGKSSNTNKGSLLFVSKRNTSTGTGGSFTFARQTPPTPTNPSGSWEDRMAITESGEIFLFNNVGIGTYSNLTEKLNIHGNIKFTSSATGYRAILGNSPDQGLYLSGSTDGAAIMLNGKTKSGDNGDIFLVSKANNITSQGGSFTFARQTPSTTPGVPDTWENRMIITENGNVIIGNVTDNNNYKLFVEQGILTEKVRVALSSDPDNWSDFVFDENYDLKPLAEVEKFIQKNKHLPEIPSTAEVHKEGLDLAQMDAKLLQKVEELTLYIIQQQKEINELKKKLK